MKKALIVISAALTGLATTTGIVTTLFVAHAENAETATRLYTTSGVLALGAIGLFFAGLITPKDLK